MAHKSTIKLSKRSGRKTRRHTYVETTKNETIPLQKGGAIAMPLTYNDFNDPQFVRQSFTHIASKPASGRGATFFVPGLSKASAASEDPDLDPDVPAAPAAASAEPEHDDHAEALAVEPGIIPKEGTLKFGLSDDNIETLLTGLHAEAIQRYPTLNYTTSSMVCYFSGHGHDGDISDRNKITETIQVGTFSFIENSRKKQRNYFDVLLSGLSKASISRKRAQLLLAFENYIENCIFMQMSMGEPGPSSPMSGPDFDILGRWYALSSSEVEIALVGNSYYLLYEKLNPENDAAQPCNVCDLMELNRLIRIQLRANFRKLWLDNNKNLSFDDQWQKDYLKLLKDDRVWVQKLMTKNTADRYYELAPSDTDLKSYRVHEGLLLFLFLMFNGLQLQVPGAVPKPVVDYGEFKNWLTETEKSMDGYVGGDKDEYQETLNLHRNESNFMEESFCRKFLGSVDVWLNNKPPAISYGVCSVSGILKANIMKVIEAILISVREKKLWLSQICFLGFLLNIQFYTLWDPACRPLEDESKVRVLRGSLTTNPALNLRDARKGETLKYPGPISVIDG